MKLASGEEDFFSLFAQEAEVPLRAEYVRKILRIQRATEGKPHYNYNGPEGCVNLICFALVPLGVEPTSVGHYRKHPRL